MIIYSSFAVVVTKIFTNIVEYGFNETFKSSHYLRPDLNLFINNAYPGISSDTVAQIDKTRLDPDISETYLILTDDKVDDKDILVDMIDIVSDRFIVVFINKSIIDNDHTNIFKILLKIYLELFKLVYNTNHSYYSLEETTITSSIKTNLAAEYIIFIEALLGVYRPDTIIELINEYNESTPSNINFHYNFNVSFENRKGGKVTTEELVNLLDDRISLHLNSRVTHNMIENCIYNATLDLLYKGEILRMFKIITE